MVASWRAIVALASLSVAGCEDVVVLPPENGTPFPSDAGLPDGAAPPLPECRPPEPVSEGLVWVGNLQLDETGALLPTELCVEGWASRTFYVPRFYLDVDEVTERCYLACVDEGACAPAPALSPSEPMFPVQLTNRSAATTFCAFRGGRLPTLPELNRAAQSASFSVAQTAIYSRWLQCSQATFETPDCQTLLEAAYAWPRRPIRSYAEDVGPFGHYDLFGASHELTASSFTYAKDPDDPYCTAAPDAVAPTMMSSDPDMLLNFGPGELYLYGFLLPTPDSPTTGGLLRTFYADFSLPEVDNGDLRGFRCAYDVEK